MSNSTDEQPHVPAPSLWPIGFAIGIACLLVGLVISWAAAIVGLLLAIVFAALWIRDLARARASAPAAELEAPAVDIGAAGAETHAESYGRGGFLSLATLGLGGVIGAGVTLPSLGFAVLPSFEGENVKSKPVDLGPIANFPEGTFVIATFTENPAWGDVSRRTAYIRNNGPTTDKQPSFTIIFSRCVHLGCPVQPNGPKFEDKMVKYKDVTLTPVQPAGFGCPCHGGAYDTEGNRVAGPPVRSLDRFAFSIVNGNLTLGRPFSVGHVDGTGADAKIERYRKAYPGVHVDGIERWLYPIPVPGS
jgi:menaquinol-cytochrome c reductase iron-sulfur subunit